LDESGRSHDRVVVASGGGTREIDRRRVSSKPREDLVIQLDTGRVAFGARRHHDVVTLGE
jgi:hypothetical protein